MARAKSQQLPVLSVLDRLLDFEPDVSREPVSSPNQVLRDLKQAVRRDLENLLNTRVRCLPYPPLLKELHRSLMNYGIPDLTRANLSGKQEREEFCTVLQTLLRQYEPRFKSVQVELLSNAEPLDRTLRFRIDALLATEPAPEPIVFDSTLKPITGSFEVKGVAS